MKRALVVVAHNDDEVLGCGGTIKKFRQEGIEVGILILSLGTTERGKLPNYAELMEQSYNASVHLGAGPKRERQSFGAWGVLKEQFKDQRFDEESEIDITKRIEMHIKQFNPEVVLTHFEGDLNKDHEIVSKCVKVACRSTETSNVDVVIEFPVISSSNFNVKAFEPDTYIELLEEDIQAKVLAMKCYTDEYGGLRSEDSIRTTARYHGMNGGFKYAEVFKTVMCRVRRS